MGGLDRGVNARRAAAVLAGAAVVLLTGAAPGSGRGPSHIPLTEPAFLAQTVSDGAALYEENCAGCHGAGGEGDFGPSLLEGSLTPEELTQVIVNGATGMPAFQGTLDPAQIEATVQHIATLQSGQSGSEGAALYEENCAACHGAGGEGGLGPSLLEGAFTPEELTQVIINGATGMPAFQGTLDPAQIEATVQHVTALQSGQAEPPPEPPPEPTALGVDLYTAWCATCHGTIGEGSGGGVGLSLQASSASFEEIVAVVTTGRGLMPLFAETLDPTEIREVAAFAKALQSSSPSPAGLSPSAGPAEIFAFECAGCHGAGGEGGFGPVLAGTTLTAEQIAAMVAGGTTMGPAFGERLSAGQIEAVAAYVADLEVAVEEVEPEEPARSRTDVFVYLSIVALTVLKLSVDHRRLRRSG